MIFGVLTGTERGDILIMSETVITIRDWVDQQHPDLVDALTIFRPHQLIQLTKWQGSEEIISRPLD